MSNHAKRRKHPLNITAVHENWRPSVSGKLSSSTIHPGKPSTVDLASVSVAVDKLSHK